VRCPDAAFERIRLERVQGVVVFQDAGMVARASLIAQSAIRERLLAVSGWRPFVDARFVAAYGACLANGSRRPASCAYRLLKGASAADRPVELPSRFELALNLAPARTIGVTVPPTLVARADEVVR
jgi:putative tryptophan/tyrosine transport system substrate-binding protein